MNSTRKLIRALDPAYIEEDKDIPKLTALRAGISKLLESEITDRGTALANVLEEVVQQSRAAIATKGGKRKSTSKKMQAKYKSKTRSNKH
jgi:hypothetical protein